MRLSPHGRLDQLSLIKAIATSFKARKNVFESNNFQTG